MEGAVEETQKEGAENVLPDSSTAEKIPTPPTQDTSKKSRKESRSKDDKSIEQFMKELNSVPLEEKVSLLCKKYVQLAEDNKKKQFHIKQSEKLYAASLKEKELLRLEHNKSVLVKSKLENLCRELQKQNRAIKDESLLKLREEEERRKETQAKFQNTLSEITNLLQQNNEKNAQLRDDNISMSEKFKSVVQQYQLREEQVDKMARQMALESELADAKMQKASLEHQAERERLLTEIEHIKVTMAQYRAKIAELQGTEENLRSQLAIYTDKYNEFQNALVKSNQFYGGFKEQMELMSNKIKKLEKESLKWKKRWETSQTALIDMCGERQASEEKAASVARQLAHMQGLCRTLQAERTVLLSTLKDNNIERPPLPSPPPAAPAPAPSPAPAPLPTTGPNALASNAKVDAMAANCAQLRQSLAHLQSQLNVLTNKQNSPPVEPPKQEKTKKSKSKKNKDKLKEKSDIPVESVKDATEENQSQVSENKVENDIEIPDDKIDDKTLESFMEAINCANMNLCDLEVGSDDFEDNVETNEKLNPESKNDDKKEEKVIKDSDKINENDANITETKAESDSKVEVEDIKVNNKVEPVNGSESNIENKEILKENIKEDNPKTEEISKDSTSNEEIEHIPEVKPISNVQVI